MQPEHTNPRLIAALVEAGAAIVSVSCTTASLEDVYATALGPERESPPALGPEPAPAATAGTRS